MTQTSFSVIITCYNHSAFIREAVQSALSQTSAAREIIVVDDASTDGAPDLLRQYDDAITLIALEDNRGGSAARNLGASTAQGDYLVFLDGDDVLQPWALEVYERLVAVKKPKVILCSLLYFEGPTVLGSSLYFRDATPMLHADALPSEIAIVGYDCLMNKDRSYRASASAIVVERHAFEEVNGWTEAIFPAEDYDLMLKLGYSGRAIQIDSPPTACCRIHPGNTMRQVPRCASMLCRVIERAQSGVYTAGGRGRLGAYAFLGGPVYFWLKNSLKARCYTAAFDLFSRGLPLIIIAAVRRLKVTITGRRPVEVLPGLCGSDEKSKTLMPRP
jgi:glycosyltransferase involved in cell wall biosynthesis